MLRALLAALIVANLLFFGYTRGMLEFLGLDPLGDREPQRLAKQVRPQAIRLLPMSATASAPGDAAVTCYETPTFTAAEAAAVESTLAGALPAGAWIDSLGERNVGARVETTHTYRVLGPDTGLAARLATLRLEAGGRGFSFSPCARPEPPR